MVYSNNFSDYGSGNSSNDSSMSFGGPDNCRARSQPPSARPKQKSSSYVDLVMGRCTLEDVMQEFRMNGSDSAYSPAEDRPWSHRADDLIGMGPSSAYLRQKSWPDPERTPAVKLPRPAAEWQPPAAEFTASTPLEEEPPAAPTADTITSEQLRVLSSLSNSALYALLRALERGRAGGERARPRRHFEECRFCKNNGERESFYRSHALKDARGRVACPVLRAFTCARCGAGGDHAHTIKYCPLSTNEERLKSAAMMRSVRMASGRHRAPAPAAPAPPRADYVILDAAPYALQDNDLYAQYGEAAPLDPMWAALEQKLML